MKNIELHFENFLISTDRTLMDVDAIHDFLSKDSTWSKDIPIEKVLSSIENSLCFGLFDKGKQIGFARVISDFSTIAYLGDVYILNSYRGFGLSKKLMDVIISHPDLHGLRRWILLTSTAEWLYTKYGFTKISNPEIYMELYNPDIYSR